MAVKKTIILCGECLGTKVTINKQFKDICDISSYVAKCFIELINNSNIKNRVTINGYYFVDNNTICIMFYDKKITAKAILSFSKDTNGSICLVNENLIYDNENVTHESNSKENYVVEKSEDKINCDDLSNNNKIAVNAVNQEQEQGQKEVQEQLQEQPQEQISVSENEEIQEALEEDKNVKIDNCEQKTNIKDILSNIPQINIILNNSTPNISEQNNLIDKSVEQENDVADSNLLEEEQLSENTEENELLENIKKEQGDSVDDNESYNDTENDSILQNDKQIDFGEKTNIASDLVNDNNDVETTNFDDSNCSSEEFEQEEFDKSIQNTKEDSQNLENCCNLNVECSIDDIKEILSNNIINSSIINYNDTSVQINNIDTSEMIIEKLLSEFGDIEQEVVDVINCMPKFDIEDNEFIDEVVEPTKFNLLESIKQHLRDSKQFVNEKCDINDSSEKTYNNGSMSFEEKIETYQKSLVGYDKKLTIDKINKLKEKLRNIHGEDEIIEEGVLDAEVALLLEKDSKAFRILGGEESVDVVELKDGTFLSKENFYQWGDLLILEE